MKIDHQIIHDDESFFYEDLYDILPNHKPSETLSLKRYNNYVFTWDEAYSNSDNSTPKEAIDMLDRLPKLKDNLRQRDKLEITFEACGCQVPEGLGELPSIWVESIIDCMCQTDWGLYLGTCPKAVFDWKSVKPSQGSLEITFPIQIPHPEYDWKETAEILLYLHSVIDGVTYKHWKSCKAKS